VEPGKHPYAHSTYRNFLLKLPFLAALLASNGCAFGAMTLELPVESPSLGTGSGKNRQVVVKLFTDARTIRGRCGMKKNGYNMDTADAVCSSEPTRWISDLLARGLSRSGFSVIKSDMPQGENVLVIEGSLQKLFVEPVVGFWTGSLEADIQVDLTASTNTGLRATRTFFSKGIRSGQMAFTSGSFQAALRRATEEIVRNMVEAIEELANKFPTVGAGESGWSVARATRTSND